MPTPKEIEEKMKEFISKNDWKGLAKAFQEGNIEWHAKEWESFIQSIREKSRKERDEELREEIEFLSAEIINQSGDEYIKRSKVLSLLKETEETKE